MQIYGNKKLSKPRKYPVKFQRPRLEHTWNPYRKQSIGILENTDLPKLRNLNYSQRLAKLNFTTLKERRDRIVQR